MGDDKERWETKRNDGKMKRSDGRRKGVMRDEKE
jgi:hypothetical protein